MTDEEYQSSYEYFFDLYEESKLKKQFALESVSEIYQQEI